MKGVVMYAYKLDDEGNREFSPDPNPTVDQPPNKVMSSLPDPVIKCEGRCRSKQTKNKYSNPTFAAVIRLEERENHLYNTVSGTRLFDPGNFV
jgi:hypothetical protein